jgi:hypothetical protein
MNNLGVEIGGNFVSFAELRSDVQACYRKGMGSNFCFLPKTVEALLDYIAAQQSFAPDGEAVCTCGDDLFNVNPDGKCAWCKLPRR